MTNAGRDTAEEVALRGPSVQPGAGLGVLFVVGMIVWAVTYMLLDRFVWA